ncbi:MAG: hypothetical protein HY931_04040 [Candidatus Falkowbacteria bacterium]|nr:MAG: hypothetical protein HY931_04040 [Candidatus Falkowbacteria bacterium]
MPAKYLIKPGVWLLKDEAGTKFHLSQDDYFGTIATILSLWRQNIEKNPDLINPDFYQTLNEVEKDLIWLQQNYQIKPRIKKKNKIPKGRERSQ